MLCKILVLLYINRNLNNNEENPVKQNRLLLSQSNPKFFDVLNNDKHLDTIQFNAGKDYLQAPKQNDKNFQTNMNHTL